MKKQTSISLLLLVTMLLTGCQATDVVGKGALSSFDKLVSGQEKQIQVNEDSFKLVAPDQTSSLSLAKDFNKSNQDIKIELDLTPFIKAGLDKTKLIKDYEINGNTLTIPLALTGTDQNESISDAMSQVIKYDRDKIGYHDAMDHYGVMVGNGNMVEWAKDMTTNDKDLVFVLNPQPFKDAGVDLTKIDGWKEALVETKDDKGNMIEVSKLLKPFSLN